MRHALVFASVVLALGLAAYFVAAPGRDAPEHEAAVPKVAPHGAGVAAPIARVPAERPLAERATQAHPPSSEQRDEDLALVPPPDASAIAEIESPTAPQPIESPQQRVDRLIAAGFSAERAAAIVQTESELKVTAAYTEYQRSGTVRALNPTTRIAIASALREELGDADYERYLAATGQPTRVMVGDVEPESAAANAGFLPGDEIRDFRGRRIFNVSELNAAMLDGDSGQTVPATIVRDGHVLQLYVSGGELGIAARSALTITSARRGSDAN
jgi:hypothetical protein